jgi:glycosyltransferase 2 family protein
MKKLFSILISVIILFLIYSKVNLNELVSVIQNASLSWISISFILWLPAILLMALRFYILTPKNARLRYIEAVKLVFLACTLNLLLPSKMGDLAKSYFLWEQKEVSKSLALSIGIMEKAFDLLMVFLIAIIGLSLYWSTHEIYYLYALIIIVILFITGISMVISPSFAKIVFYFPIKLTPKKIATKLASLETTWITMQNYIYKDKKKFIFMIFISTNISFLFLVQMWFLILALNLPVSFLSAMALLPLGIIAGWLPFTFAGVGTRDAAFVGMLKATTGIASASAFGLLCTIRLIVPAIIGLPLFIARFQKTRKK